MTKQELREHIKAQIRLMPTEEREASSRQICWKISATPEWQNAGTVLLYAALPDEVDLSLLIQNAEQQGKRVLLPVVDGDSLLIRVYEPEHMASSVKYNIAEPTEHCPAISNPDEIDLAVIPGRAFSHDGQRMGRGKGYYDRLLPSLHCPKWGVAFACQVVDELPSDPWDVRLDNVIAE